MHGQLCVRLLFIYFRMAHTVDHVPPPPGLGIEYQDLTKSLKQQGFGGGGKRTALIHFLGTWSSPQD
jgi:hypothetical protein